MVWKYIVISFILVGFVFAYPLIQSTFNLSTSYSIVVVVGFVALAFLITPLYWIAIVKQGKKEKEKYSRPKQPWE
jgi:uncharacterized membrane protein YciS (DUF1049 family)